LRGRSETADRICERGQLHQGGGMINGKERRGLWKFDRILLQTTGTFLRRLRHGLLIIILIAVLPILGLIIYQAKIARDVQIVEAQENAWEILENVAIRELRFLEAARQLLTLLAETPEVAGNDNSACSDFLRRFAEHNKLYVDIGVADSRGQVRCRAQDLGYNGVAASSLFEQVVTAKSFAVGDYQLHEVGQRKSVNFGYPILTDQGDVSSVIFAALDVNWIVQLAAESNLPEGVALSIVDRKGTLLTRFPDPEKWLGKHIPDASLFEMLQLRSQGTRELVGLDGVDRLYALKPLSLRASAGQIYAMVSIPKEVAFGQVNRSLARNLIWLALVSMFATGIAWFIGSKFVVGYVKVRAEAEESRLQLAAIVESAEDAIIGMTLGGNVTSWNEGAESMYGFSADEMVGQPIYRLIPETHHGEVSELLEIVKHGRGINRYESARIRKGGGLFDVSASLSPIRDLRGTVVGAATITRDVTLLRKGEDQLLAYTDQLETLNLVSQEIAGTLSVAEVLERGLSRLVSAKGFNFAFAHLSQDVAGRKFYAASAESLSLSELERIWSQLGPEFEQCLWECRNPWFVEDVAAAAELSLAAENNRIKSLAVLPLARGAPVHAALALMSTRVHSFGTDEKQFLQAISREIALALENAKLYGATVEVNQELRREIEERKRAERTLADFTAMVAHDLRSPLSNVLSITDSICDGIFGPVNELQQKWLWKVQESCRSLISHVSDFLDISKIDAGQLQLAREPIDIAFLLRNCLLAYSVEADKRKIKLKINISDRLPQAWLDHRRINQVVDNLLSNALKFTASGGEIEVAAQAWGDGEILVSVKDSGIGIPPDELDLVFDMYRQVGGSRSATKRDTGLGLAICKKIVEAHGGRIWVESDMGRGSAFYVSLPLQTEERSYAATPA
jgi:PAS domain S-box-containing protein